MKLSPGINRQSAYSLPEVVTNYAELKEKFAETEWEKFFKR